MRPPSSLQEHQAIAIFIAKFGAQARDGTSALLAVTYNTSSKVVRDIWNVRTWTSATRPFWRREDEQLYLKNRMCRACKHRGIESLDTHAACYKCLSKLGDVLQEEPYQSSKQCTSDCDCMNDVMQPPQHHLGIQDPQDLPAITADCMNDVMRPPQHHMGKQDPVKDLPAIMFEDPFCVELE
jgi:hypothetical protein